MTLLLPATPENIALAAQRIKEGGLVAFPTETVYGLGANALDAEAAARIFSAKQRPAADPLIVHLAGLEQVEQVARPISPLARRLAKAFWPGPLTLILPKQPIVPEMVTAGLDTVAVRVPSHPVALALIRAAETPIAAPSANRFGKTSPTTARHVWHDLKGRIDIILDGGPTPVGVESTVLDVSVTPPRILRPGGVTRESLEAIIGPVSLLPSTAAPQEGLSSPGLLSKHYAPRAELIFFIGADALTGLLTRLQAEQAAGRKVGALVVNTDADLVDNNGALVYRLGLSLESAAHRIYAGMRWLDRQGVEVILCRDLGESGLGLAIRDRLKRAASRIIET
ncbi:MAG: L-threonylcarbamoyladenylate synthase [Candidatus Villigracilaceae bacterium]